MRNFVTNSVITNNLIEDCGIYDFTYRFDGKVGEAIYIGTSSNQVGGALVLGCVVVRLRSRWVPARVCIWGRAGCLVFVTAVVLFKFDVAAFGSVCMMLRLSLKFFLYVGWFLEV